MSLHCGDVARGVVVQVLWIQAAESLLASKGRHVGHLRAGGGGGGRPVSDMSGAGPLCECATAAGHTDLT